MDKYFYKQFKRLFELMEMQHELYKDMYPQFQWAESVKERQEMEELGLIMHSRLLATRKRLIDDLREKLMIRIRRKTGIDMEYKWLEYIAYIDADGKQSNLYGLHLPDEVTGKQKSIIIIVMRAITKNPSVETKLHIELRESDEDSVYLYHDGGWQRWRLKYRLDSDKKEN